MRGSREAFSEVLADGEAVRVIVICASSTQRKRTRVEGVGRSQGLHLQPPNFRMNQ